MCISLQVIYRIIASILVILYTLFAPEMFFHNTYKKENPKLFDRWEEKRLIWNLHQSFIHFVGSTIGFVALDILLFNIGIDDPKKYGFTHLFLFLIAVSGIMGFIPRILFESKLSK